MMPGSLFYKFKLCPSHSPNLTAKLFGDPTYILNRQGKET